MCNSSEVDLYVEACGDVALYSLCLYVCVCVSLSGNECVAKQNRSSNLVFMQLACLPRRTHAGEYDVRPQKL